MLCALARVAFLMFLLIVIGYIFYVNRYRLEAKIWHWQHGYSARMGNYVVPVPEHWLIWDQDSAGFTLMNLSPTFSRRDGKFHTTAVISIFPFREGSFGAGKMDSWLSLEHQRLAREGVKYVEEKTLNFDGEVVKCIGGSELSAIVRNIPNVRHPEMDIRSLNCMSDHGLNILFVGEPSDLQFFYSFVSQIRRRS